MNPVVRLVGVGVLVVGLFAGSLAAMACQQPVDDAGTDGVVDPTSEAETDSGSQP